MSKYSRVMWSEGMFLLPQHFQYQDEFHQRQLAETTLRSTPFNWGVQTLEVDRDALAKGTLRLQRLKLVFPDGSLYDAPQQDPLPAARDLRELFKGDHLMVHAALKLSEPFGRNYVEDELQVEVGRRFRKCFNTLPDLNEGELENEITSLRFNVVLLVGGDCLDGYSYCPLVRLVRNSLGGFDPDPLFAAPALHLGSQGTLSDISQNLLGVLQEKSQRLSRRRRERADQVVEFGSSDVTLFWLLNTVNRAWPRLAHLHAHPGQHPQQLYLVLAELAGTLLTFSPEGRLADLPPYNHEDPALALLSLEGMIRSMLENVIPETCVVIELTPGKPAQLTGLLHDPRLAQADFYFSAHADMPGADLLDLVPRAIKVGSQEDIGVVVNSAMPGVPVRHATRLPSAIPMRLDNQYFAIEPGGQAYERMMKSQSICFYVPATFINLKLELMAVLK